jgi:hypothetical protein
VNDIKTEVTAFLRFGCGGGMFLLTFNLVTTPLKDMTQIQPDGGWVAAVVAVSIVFGIFFYAVHRALVYPLVLHCFHRQMASMAEKNKAKGRFYEVTEYEADLNEERWKRRENAKEFQRSLDVWGSESHFLYVATLAIWGALILAALSGTGKGCGSYITLAILSALSLVGALIHDRRCIQMDIILHERSPHNGVK